MLNKNAGHKSHFSFRSSDSYIVFSKSKEEMKKILAVYFLTLRCWEEEKS